jgi:hypothetical protein
MIRGIRWEGCVACTGKMRNEYKILVRKPEGKRPFERHRYTLKYNKMDLKNYSVRMWCGFNWLTI